MLTNYKQLLDSNVFFSYCFVTSEIVVFNKKNSKKINQIHEHKVNGYEASATGMKHMGQH